MARSRAADHADKRAAILVAAARVFAREGYGIASMAQVAAEAGVSKANLYHYADGKEALLFDLLDAHLRRLRAIQAEAAPGVRPALEALLIAYEGADAEHAVQINAIRALPPSAQATLRSIQRDMVADMRARLVAEAPSLATDPDRLRALTMSVYAMANWHTQWAGGADAEARRDYAALIDTLLAGGIPAILDGRT